MLKSWRCLSLSYYSHGDQGLSFSALHCFRRLLLYSTSSSPPQSLADHLMHSLSFSQQQASSFCDQLIQTQTLSTPKLLNDPNVIRKADSLITFLKQNAFAPSQIRETLIFKPQILMCHVEKTLKPKFEALQEHGFSGSDLALLVSANPSLILRALDSTIVPAVRALRQLLSNEDAVAIMKKSNHGYFIAVVKFILPNVALLLNYGIPMNVIRKRLILRPTVFMLDTKSFEDKLIRAEEKFGIPRDSKMFLHAVELLGTMSEKTMESKFQVLRSFGWSESQIVLLMRRNPNCFRLSKENIRKSLNYIIKELGYELEYVLLNPPLLTCSLEKRLVPRHKTMVFLKEKGLVKLDYAFSTVAFVPESKFRQKFVLPFKEVHQVYAKLTGIPVAILTQGSMDSAAFG